MAVTIDSTQTFSSGASAITHTISFNNVAGTTLVVGFTCLRNVVGDSVSGITYNGVSLTKIAHQNGSANNRTTNQWRLANPSTGTNNLVITLIASERVYGAIQSYTGEDTSSPVNIVAQGTTSGTSVTFPITTTVDNCFLFGSAQTNRTVGSYDTNTTSVYSVNSNTEIIRSTADITPAGATTLGMTFTVSDPGLPYIVTAIKPASASPTFIPRVSFIM